MRKENRSKASRIRYLVSFAIDRASALTAKAKNDAVAPVSVRSWTQVPWDCFGLLKRDRQDSSSVGYVPKTLAWLRWERILDEETQHFLRCEGPLWIRIGAGRAAARPGAAGTVDIPVLQYLAFAVDVDRAGLAMPAGYLPAMYLLLRRGRSDNLPTRRAAVVGMRDCV